MNRHVKWGQAAILAGTPDAWDNDDFTNVVDTLANIMHYCEVGEIEFEDALNMATDHFDVEVTGKEDA